MEKMFTPLQVSGIRLKNRIVFAPTSMGTAGAEAYEEIAAGGAGLIVMADLSVVPSMLGAPGLDTDTYQEKFRQITERCHRYDCKVSAQLFHPEYDPVLIRSLYLRARNGEGITPDEVRRRLAENTREYCDTLTEPEIEQIIRAFAAAAVRAEKAGFDMVQIHGDRLIGSFTSPLFNHREDVFGGHAKLPVRIVRAVREAVPDMTVDYKLTVRMENKKLGRGGISEAEVPEFVRMLDGCGVDSYHVSLANHTDTDDTIPLKNHPQLTGEGCFVNLAKLVKQYTTRPVCTVGKLQTPQKVEAVLESGLDLAAMSRQLIADSRWVQKVQSGRTDELVYCLYCNQKCMGALRGGRPVGCILHQAENHQA